MFFNRLHGCDFYCKKQLASHKFKDCSVYKKIFINFISAQV